jgi:dihydropyrimidinase
MSRPPEVEGEAANRAIRIAEVLGVPLYLVHTSCIDALEAITRARLEGQQVFGEVLAQHLVIDDSVYRNPDWDAAAHYVMSPPFRAKEHQAALWRALQSGMLQTTATDHCCFCTPQKRAGLDDFRKIPNGTGGVEDRMARALAPRRAHRAADAERVRGRHVVELREDLQHLPAARARSCRAPTPTSWCGTQRTRTISAKTHHQNIDFNIYEGMESPATRRSR